MEIIQILCSVDPVRSQSENIIEDENWKFRIYKNINILQWLLKCYTEYMMYLSYGKLVTFI
jgi:hypothetical protein